MNVFQYIAIGLLGLLAWATVRAALGGGVRKRVAAFWLSVWLSAAAIAIWPKATVPVARALGIGRGADLVLYASAFASLVGFFYVYTRFRRMDREMTLLVRQLAVEHPLLPKDDRKPEQP